ncbi:MAG: hypothetical protein Q9197_002155 [Variospora fuerteventurae]
MMPIPRAIRYVWKVPRPTGEDRAEDLMEAAYYTAMQTDRTATVILIRSDIPHPTTYSNGSYVPDGFHITISTKNTLQEQAGTFQTTHGYTKGKYDLTLAYAKSAPYINSDDDVDYKGNLIWPAGLPEEKKWHPI